MPKPVLKALCGLFLVSLFAMACNSGGDKKDAPADTMAPAPAPAPPDTGGLMKTDTMPVKTTDKAPPPETK